MDAHENVGVNALTHTPRAARGRLVRLELDGLARAWLGTRVLSSRWVSGTYLLRRSNVSAGAPARQRARFTLARSPQRAWARRVVTGVAVFAIWAALQWDVRAAAASVADRARALITEVEASSAARELVAPAVGRAKQALSRAETAAPALAPALEDAALEWAEAARDLARARAAARASDALEHQASALATEIARVRAAVEQAMARVGRARQDLKQLEATTASTASTHTGAAAKEGAAPAKPVAAPANALPANGVPARDAGKPPAAPRAPAASVPAAPERK
jgi:hypothetical protein